MAILNFSKGHKRKPSPYPALPFHGLRCAQLVSSIVVAAIMGYFCWQLKKEGFVLPWTFIVLLTTSTLTLLVLILTTLLHTHLLTSLPPLSPALSLSFNLPLSLLWTLGFALDTWWTRTRVLSHLCTPSHWDTAVGISVCRLFKASYAFVVVGFVGTAAATWLDYRVLRRERGRGVYGAMDGAGNSAMLLRDVPGRQEDVKFGRYLMDEGRESVNQGRGLSGERSAKGIPEEFNPNPSAKRRGGNDREGYMLPEEQFRYEDENAGLDEDTRYHGAGGARGL